MNEINKKKSDVYEFIKNLKLTNKVIDDEIDIYKDLKIYGDDVEEFFKLFEEKFKVDISKLNVSGCFSDEGLLSRFCFCPTRRILVKHLVEAATTGKWPELEKTNNGS